VSELVHAYFLWLHDAGALRGAAPAPKAVGPQSTVSPLRSLVPAGSGRAPGTWSTPACPCPCRRGRLPGRAPAATLRHTAGYRRGCQTRWRRPAARHPGQPARPGATCGLQPPQRVHHLRAAHLWCCLRVGRPLRAGFARLATAAEARVSIIALALGRRSHFAVWRGPGKEQAVTHARERWRLRQNLRHGGCTGPWSMRVVTVDGVRKVA